MLAAFDFQSLCLTILTCASAGYGRCVATDRCSAISQLTHENTVYTAPVWIAPKEIEIRLFAANSRETPKSPILNTHSNPRRSARHGCQCEDAGSPAPFRSSTVRRIVSCRYEDKTRGSPKEGKTSLPNVVIAEIRRPDNVNTAIPLAWYRSVWGSRT